MSTTGEKIRRKVSRQAKKNLNMNNLSKTNILKGDKVTINVVTFMKKIINHT